LKKHFDFNLHYELQRNKLIDTAERYANRNASDKRYMREGEGRADRWNRLFHLEMNRLAKEAGI